MPQIRLKPSSPDFVPADALAARDTHPRRCDMPGCMQTGDHRAPKDRGLKDYYNFCLDHVQDYNAAWNFFAGMAERDIEKQIIASFYGDRPTWRADYYRGLEADLTARAEAFRQFHEDEPPPQTANPKTPEGEALTTLGLVSPTTFMAIKKRYRELVKQYHPDHHARTGPDPARDERLKQINMAYTLLKMEFSGRTVR